MTIQTNLRIIIFNEEVLRCTLCELCKSRSNVVLARGLYRYPIFVIGEAPGETEDHEATPFVGDSGVLLERIFTTVLGISTQDCYVTNVIKCRPPNNKITTKEWERACYQYLYQEIQVLQPKVIIPLGNNATKTVLPNSDPISRVNGTIFFERVPHPDNHLTRKQSEKRWSDAPSFILPLYHPSALIRHNTLEATSPKDQVARALHKHKELLLDPDKHYGTYLQQYNETNDLTPF